jgi:N-acetylglutamate synthase-like GNAT family acetyltransferase
VRTSRLKIRRGKRVDFAAVMALVQRGEEREWPSEKALVRLFRRLVSDLGYDLYVAERDGQVCGVVMVGYRRLLVQGGLCAVLDGVITTETGGEIEQQLIAFAQERAHKKGCRLFQAQVSKQQREEWERLLCAAGFTPAGEWFSCSLR